jgi:hypothetical protein
VPFVPDTFSGFWFRGKSTFEVEGMVYEVKEAA